VPKFSPTEGWITVFVGVAMMLLLGLVIDPDNGIVEARTLGLLTAVGYLTGFLLAKTRMPDLLAHLVAIVTGLVGAVVAVEPRQTLEALQGFQLGELLRRNWDRVDVLVDSFGSGARLPDDVAQIAISLTIWLVGYSSAWMLFRRGWLVWSLFLPATIFLTSLALDRDQPTWPALAFTALAIVQAARYTTYSRAGVWQRRGLRAPRGLGQWSAVAGVALSAAVVLAGVGAPLTVPDDTREWVVAQSQSAADAVIEQLDRLPTSDGDTTPAGNYGQFSDEFRIGEGVPAGDTPIALLRAASPSYLAARKFDDYDGRGWSSSYDMIPGSGANVQPPRISFNADQPMNLPEPVVSSRNDRSGVITLYEPGSGLILTLETHESASIPTAVRVGWQEIDETFVVDDVVMMDVPVDLRSLVGLLKLAQFETDSSEPENVRPADPSLQSAVAAERDSLLERYPVETTLTYDESVGVILTAKGRLPVYEDVEGVFYSGEGIQPATYSVVGLEPNVTVDELRQSSQDYSAYIESRYLELPESVTLRTSQLAAQIVADAGAVTPVEMAFAIQDYLRNNYDYLLESSLAPDGQDIVDYFLFDRQVGRCDHFASSMIVMLRSLGVPARIVTGLAPAQYDETASGYLYRAQDAHAWVEVYFPEYGWIPFEPTPSESPIDLSSVSDEEEEQPEAAPTPSAEAEEPAVDPEPTAEPSPVAAVSAENPDSGSTLLDETTSFPGVALVALLIVALVAALFMAIWLIPLRGLRPGASYFLRFQRLAKFWGVEQHTTMTPAEYAEVYGVANPRFAGAASSIADAFVGERYGPDDRAGTAASRALQGWLELRKSVATWRPWRRWGRNSR
jgi:transglutaminase-like putative cysteine protease